MGPRAVAAAQPPPEGLRSGHEHTMLLSLPSQPEDAQPGPEADHDLLRRFLMVRLTVRVSFCHSSSRPSPLAHTLPNSVRIADGNWPRPTY
jgi:hypothetical protein